MKSCVKFSLFSQPKMLSPQVFSQGGGSCSGSQVPLSTSPTNPIAQTTNPTSFRNFIHNVFLARELHPKPVTSFCLNCKASNFDLSDSDLIKWVNVAIKRKIEILIIKVPYTCSGFSVGRFIFTCRTLVVLKLTQIYLDLNFSSANLPSLKTLHLKDVSFVGPEYLVHLLNGVQFLRIWIYIFLYCNNSDGSYTCKEELKSLPMLVRANIVAPGSDVPVKASCNAKFLNIDEDAVYHINDIPAFPNLTHLEIFFEGENWHFVLEMLRLCPKLQSFELEFRFSSTDAVWPSPIFVPECLFSQLTECSIRAYHGTEIELMFARYIMLNSRALSTIKKWGGGSRGEDEMFDELALCPLISPTCDLFFSLRSGELVCSCKLFINDYDCICLPHMMQLLVLKVMNFVSSANLVNGGI